MTPGRTRTDESPSSPKRHGVLGPLPTVYEWSSRTPAAAVVDSGSEFWLDVPDSSCGQISEDSTSTDLARVDFARVDGTVGPIEIRGAEPGDAVRVRILRLTLGTWGWTAVFRHFGLLQDRFDDDLVVWRIGRRHAEPISGFLRPVTIPLRPMLGWVGLAPEKGVHSMIPPRRTGGNMDSPFHTEGSEMLLPVEVAGALLMVGDPHAIQGFGEVCGTGIETSARVRLRVDVLKGQAPAFPRVRVGRSPDFLGSMVVASGIDPDLKIALRLALENLIAVLQDGGWSAKESYMLASLIADVRISEVVDEPNMVVSISFPESHVRPSTRPKSAPRRSANS